MENEQGIINAKIVNTSIKKEGIELSYILNEKSEVMYIKGMPFDQNTIFTIVSVLGVDSWESLPDTYFRIKIKFEDENNAKIIAIGNILNDTWIELFDNQNSQNSQKGKINE